MNKTELILSIAEETGFSRKNVEIALNAAIARITKALTEEEKVQIVGFEVSPKRYVSLLLIRCI